jgi:excisionase family DNA binding protein
MSSPTTIARPRLIRAPQAAREYGVAYTTLRDLVQRGELPVLRIGRAWFLERTDIDEWIASHKERATA